MGKRNITLSVDDEVVKRVRKIAIDQDTTLTAMVREYLQSVARRGEAETAKGVERLDRTFERHSRHMGPRTWTREELHER